MKRSLLHGAGQSLNLHLTDGSRHDIAPANPNQYDICTFNTTDLPIQTGQQEDAHLTRHDTPMQALGMKRSSGSVPMVRMSKKRCPSVSN